MEIAGVVIDRASEAEDLDAVAALEAECFTNPWTREMLEQEVQHSHVARVYVLRAEGYRVAAFCTCWLVDDELHINTIAVHPDLRRKGLATVLMRHLLNEAESQGAHRALLEVRRSNVPAQRLYEALGFVVAGTRRNYYSHPEEDALVLTRTVLPETPDGGLEEGL